MTKKHSTLLILSVAVLIGWSGISAAEADKAQTTPENPLLTSSDQPLPRDLGSPAQDLELPVPDLGLPPAVEASCWKQDCGNTGTRWGVGPEPGCAVARSNLNSNLWAAALRICPGPVTGITYHYDNNCQGAGPGYCKESGNADVECKICPGQSCWFDE